MPGKNYASTRYSGFADLTPGNLKDLSVDFTFSTGRAPVPLRNGDARMPSVVKVALGMVLEQY